MARSRSINLRLIILCIGMGSLYLATIFIIVGLTTNHWFELRKGSAFHDDLEAHFGLHRTCYISTDKCTNPMSDYDENDSLEAVRGLVCTSAFMAVIATGLAMVNVGFDLIGVTQKLISISSIVFCVLAGLFAMIGGIMFSEKVEIDPELFRYQQDNIFKGYSFGLTVTAGGMTWISGFLFIWSMFFSAKEKFVM